VPRLDPYGKPSQSRSIDGLVPVNVKPEPAMGSEKHGGFSMGILSSMYTGVTGLQGQGEALSIYGDNIANANHTGFKVSRPEFQDAVAKSLKGWLGGNQIGRGTRLASVQPIFSCRPS